MADEDTALSLTGRGAASLAPGALSNFLWAKGDKSLGGYLPGVATGGYAGIDSMLQMAAAAARNYAPEIAMPFVKAIAPDAAEAVRAGLRNVIPQPPHLPGAVEASRLHDLSIANARDTMPDALKLAPPTTRAQEMADEIGAQAGTLAFPFNLARLPGIAGRVGALIPHIGQMPVLAPVGGLLTAGQMLNENKEKGITGASPPVNDPRTTQVADPAATPQPLGSGSISFGPPVSFLSAPKETEPIASSGNITFGAPVSFGSAAAVPQDKGPNAVAPGAAPNFSAAAGDSNLPSQGSVLMGAGGILGLLAVLASRGKGAGSMSRAMEQLEGTRPRVEPAAAPIAAPPVAGTATTAPRTPGTPVTSTPTEVPLPSSVRTVRQNVLDQNTVINDLHAAVSDTPNMTRGFSAATGTAGDMSKTTWLKEQARTGLSYITGEQRAAPIELVRKVGNFDPPTRERFNEYMNIQDELDNRRINLAKEREAGTISDDSLATPQNPGRRVGMLEHSDEALRARVAEIERSHPQVADAANTYRRINDGMLEDMHQSGYRTPQEVADVRRNHPWHVSTVDTNGIIDQSFGVRDTTPGSRANYHNADPLSSFAQQYDAVYGEMNKNRINGRLIKDTIAAQERNPALGKFFEETPVKQENARQVTYHDENGIHHVTVNNGILHRAMVSNPTQLGVTGNILGELRRQGQSLTTGPASLIGGNLFALKNAVRNHMLIPITQQPGMVSGHLDAWGQKSGVGTLRWLPDPTRIPGTLGTMGRDMGAMVAGRFAEAFHPQSGNPLGNNLRKILGNGSVDMLRGKLENAYRTSLYAEQRGQGLAGSGAHGSMEAPTSFDFRDKTPQLRTSMSALDPTLFNGKIKGQYLNFQGLVHDINNIIGEAPNSYHYRINKQYNLGERTPQELAHATRMVVGDPGVAGAHPVMKAAANMTPYLNVSMQGMDAIAQAFKRTPMTTAATMASATMLPAIASIYTAMRSGPNAVNHLQNEMSTRQRASDVTLYHGDEDHPENATRLSLPQEMRLPYVFMLEALSHATGAFQHDQGSPMHTRVMHALGDVFSHRISNTSLESMIHATQDTIGFQAPSVLHAATNLAGVELQPAVETLLSNWHDGKPLFSGMARSLDKVKGSPNEGHDSALTNNDGKILHALLNNIGGVAAKAWDFGAAGTRDYKERGDVGHALGAVASQYAEGFRDSTPALNSVWRNNAKLSTSDPLEENVNKMRDALRPLTGALGDIRTEGFTRRGGLPIDTGDQTKVPTDPTMRSMYVIASRVASQLESRFGPQIADMRKYIDDASKKNDYYAEDQRTVVNMHTRRMHQEYEKYDAQLRVLNNALSRIAGAPVNVRNIDWSKGVEQFH